METIANRLGIQLVHRAVQGRAGADVIAGVVDLF